MLVFWGTLSGMNDVTHLCFFDIPLISNIPNMVYLAPTCKEEYLAMLEWSIEEAEVSYIIHYGQCSPEYQQNSRVIIDTEILRKLIV